VSSPPDCKHAKQAAASVLLTIFPQATGEQKKCFDLLKRAYVEARYNPGYRITKAQLEYLTERVKKLQRLTKKVCEARIESYLSA
jgi:predicted transcriptional regulator